MYSNIEQSATNIAQPLNNILDHHQKLTPETFSRAVDRLKTAPEYAHLTKDDGKIYYGKVAATNVRRELKRAFAGVKFSVRRDDIRLWVEWTDGPTRAQVEEITNNYYGRYFNGMERRYDFRKTPWTEVFGSITYIFTEREESAELAQRVIDALFEKYPGNFRGIQKPVGEAYLRGETRNIDVPGSGEKLHTLINRELTLIAA